MVTSQDMKTSHFSRLYRILLVIFILVLVSFFFIGSDFHRSLVNMLTVPRDKNGNKPRDIARAFLEASRVRNYDKAAEYWTEASLEVLNRGGTGKRASFESFCDYFQPITSYTLPPATFSEEGSLYWLYVRGILPGGSKRGYSLFFDLVNDEWKLIETSPFR